MADVFAELVASAKIDLSQFDKQLKDIKKKLGAVDDINVGANLGKNASKAKGAFDDLGKSVAKTSEGVKDAQKSTKDLASSTGNVKVEVGGIVGAYGKVLASLGAVELALGAVNVISKAFKGDMSGALDAAERLPAGIGPVIAIMRDLHDTLTGATEQLNRFRRTSEVIADIYASIKKSNEERELNVGRIKDETDAVKNQIRAEKARAAGDERRAARIEQEIANNKNLLDIQNQIEAAVKRRDAVNKTGDLTEETLFEDQSKEIVRRKREIGDAQREIKSLEKQIDSLLAGTPGQEAAMRATDLAADIQRQRSIIEGLRLGTGEEVGEDASIQTRLNAETLADLEFQVNQRQALVDNIQAEIEALKELEREQGKLNSAELKSLDAANERLDAAKALADAASDEAGAKAEAARSDREAAQSARERLITLGRLNDAAKQVESDIDRSADNVISLKSEILQRELRLQGKDFEAQVEALRQAAQRDVNNAGTFEERQLIKQNLDLAIKELKKAEDDGAEPESPKSLQRLGIRQRFEDTLASLIKSDGDAKLEKDRAKAEKRDVDRNKELQNINKGIEDMIENIQDLDLLPRFA